MTAIEKFFNPILEKFGAYIPNALGALIVLVLGWFLILIVRKALDGLLGMLRLNERGCPSRC